MTFRKALFSFKGRMSRSDYWLKGASVLIPVSIFNNYLVYGIESRTALIVATVIGIVSLWPGLALIVKRLHDRDRSGWYAATLLIPFANIIFAVIIFVQVWFLKGTDGPNRFGEDPTDPDVVERNTALFRNQLASVRRWSALFDHEKYGVIWYFVAFFAMAEVAVQIKNVLLGFLFAFNQPLLPWAFFLIQVLAAAATGAILLAVFSLVRNEWLLPLFGGVTRVVVGICAGLLLMQVPADAVNFSSPFTAERVLLLFFYGFLLIGALVLATRRWGVTPTSLVLAGIGAGLVFQIVLRLVIQQIFDPDALFRIFTISITTGAIYGAMIYASVYLHYRSRTIETAAEPARVDSTAAPEIPTG